jgi:3-dehydroquinate synthase
VALGGGVVGDLTGFVASTYLRGISYVQVPTTLLSAVDSSVGGKTAIDVEKGKNLVGAFYSPKAVIIDSEIIKNLPKNVYEQGFGEVIKYAVLDKKIYAEINKENYDLGKLIALCVSYKNKIVSKDEFEKNVRKFLNLGHTVGHALEKLSNYSIPHGIAVIMGLKSITDYAKSIGYITCANYQKIINLIDKNAKLPSVNFNSEDILSVIKNDKKRRDDFIDVVLPKKIGKVEIVKISLNDLKGVKYEGIGK